MNINRKPKVIDVKAMTKIGQMICEDYRPILELSRANILNDDYFKTSSIIRVSTNPLLNSTEELFLAYINYNPEEPASEFLRICKEIRKVDIECEYYLIFHYFYGKTNEEIIHSDEFCGARRRFYNVRNKAHLQVAYLTGNIIYKSTSEIKVK